MATVFCEIGIECLAVPALAHAFVVDDSGDMVGKKGSDKFRLDVTGIINNKLAPSRIQSLIFKEFIVQ